MGFGDQITLEELKDLFTKVGDTSCRPPERIFEIFELAAKYAATRGSDLVYTQDLLAALFDPETTWYEPHRMSNGSVKQQHSEELVAIRAKLKTALRAMYDTQVDRSIDISQMKFRGNLTLVFEHAKQQLFKIKSPEFILTYLLFHQTPVNRAKTRKFSLRRKTIAEVDLDLGEAILETAGLNNNDVRDAARKVTMFKEPEPQHVRDRKARVEELRNDADLRILEAQFDLSGAEPDGLSIDAITIAPDPI